MKPTLEQIRFDLNNFKLCPACGWDVTFLLKNKQMAIDLHIEYHKRTDKLLGGEDV